MSAASRRLIPSVRPRGAKTSAAVSVETISSGPWRKAPPESGSAAAWLASFNSSAPASAEP